MAHPVQCTYEGIFYHVFFVHVHVYFLFILQCCYFSYLLFELQSCIFCLHCGF